MKKIIYFFWMHITLLVLWTVNAQGTNKQVLTVRNTFDAANNLIKAESFSYNQFGQEVLVEKTEYDASSNITSQTKKEFTYDAITGYPIETIFYIKNLTTGVWMPISKIDIYYLSNGKKDYEIINNYDSGSGTWMPNKKLTYAYNASGLLEVYEILTYDTPSSSWIPYSKYSYTYNANGDIIEYLEEVYDTSGGVYLSSIKYQYSYPSSTQKIQEAYGYSTSSQSWIPNYKYEYNFDANGNPIEAIMFYWDSSTGTWAESSRDFFIFGSQGELQQMGWMLYMGGNWMPYFLSEFLHDTNVALPDVIFPREFYNNSFPHYLIDLGRIYNFKLNQRNYYQYDAGSSVYLLTKGELYGYQQQNVLEVRESGLVEVKIYPNPAKDFVILDTDEATMILYDAQGKQVFMSSNKKVIDVSHLPGGNYFYQVITPKGIGSGQLLIE